jgi:transposase InsO family protein
LGIGTLVLKCVIQGKAILHRISNVRHVKNARRTLLGARQLLQETGFKLEATASWARLHKDGVSKIHMSYMLNDLFVVCGELVPAEMTSAMQAGKVEASTVWHERLAHPGPSVINALKSRSLIPKSVQASSTADCPACAIGKGKRTPCKPRDVFKERPEPGQILHADLCFPKGLSPDCVLTVVDEGSRFSFAFPLKSKRDASDRLQDLILQLERKGFKTHTLRTDNGGEFTSASFNAWLTSRGIEHAYSPADTPRANGLIERYHGTLMPRLRAVLTARKIPRSLWSEVLQGVVYVLNRTPHQGLQGMIPYEQFYKRSLSSLTHLRVLGSTCYYSLPGHKSKLDARKGQAILLGYNSDGRGPTAAYKLYDVTSKRIIFSTDVIFDERPASNNGVTEALRTATVPPPPGVVIPIPPSHAQNVPDT